MYKRAQILSVILTSVLALLVHAATAQLNPETETTLFDIYLQDIFKGSVLAEFSESNLTISEPSAVLEQLTELNNVNDLLPLLTGTFEREKQIDGLGKVHYDLNTFRIIVEVDPKFLPLSKINLKRIAPDPQADFSLQQRVGVIASGTLDSDLKSAFNHRSIASYGEFFGTADGAVVADKSYELNEAAAGGIVGDFRGRAGLLQSVGNPFSPSVQFLGLGVETAEELFLDQDLIRGSKFEVFVPSKSRVEFYRDGRLIAVQVLDFGLREIDTTSFPQGSYNVEIVITDNFGNTTREGKFFTKAGFLTSRAQPTFTFQVGSIRDNLTLLDTPVFQAGTRLRAADTMDLGGSVYGSDKLQIASFEINGLYRELRFGGGISDSSEGDSGITGSIGSSIFGIGFDLSTSNTLRGGQVEAPLPTPDPKDPFAPVFDLKRRHREVVFQDRTSNYLNIYKQLGQFDIRYAAEKYSGGGSPSRSRRGPAADWRIIERGESKLRAQWAHFDTDQGAVENLGLLYTYRINPRLLFNAQIAHLTQHPESENLFMLGLNYDTKQPNDLGTRMAAHTEFQNKRVTGESLNSVTDEVDVDHTGDYFQSVGFVRDIRTSQSGNSAVGLSANSSFFVSPDGSVSIAHPVSQEAVFVAEVPSSSTGSDFEILLNNQVVGTVKAGEQSVIGVSPYKSYTVKIRPTEDADLVSYDNKVTTNTFFPGNVVKRTFKVNKVYIVIGRVVDEGGRPVGRQRIKGTRDYTATEEDGSFQTEISGEEVLEIQSTSHHCKLALPVTEKPEYFIELGDVICDSTSSSSTRL